MTDKTPQEPINRERRALFVFGYTAIFSGIAAAITLMGLQGPTAEAAVTGFIGLIWVMIVSYLTTTTVDRSEILTKLGAGFNKNDTQKQPEDEDNVG